MAQKKIYLEKGRAGVEPWQRGHFRMVYDVLRNEDWGNVRVSHDTVEFSVVSIGRWGVWSTVATMLLITLHRLSGGSGVGRLERTISHYVSTFLTIRR